MASKVTKVEVDGKVYAVLCESSWQPGFTPVTVWEIGSGCSHGEIRSFEELSEVHGGFWGNIARRPLPADIDALPAMTDERMAAVLGHRDAAMGEVARAISAAFPAFRAEEHRRDMSAFIVADWALV